MSRGERTDRIDESSAVRRSAISALVVLVAVFVVGAPSLSSAATMRYMDLGDLVDNSSLIVRGEVTNQRTFRDEDRGQVFTHTTLEVSKTYMGEAEETVTIEQWGGKVDGTTHQVPGDAEFEVGEEVVVFLFDGRDGASPPHYLVALAQSKFEVEGDGDGAVLVRDLSSIAIEPEDGEAPDLDELGRETRTLRSFEATLNALVYAKSRSKGASDE